MNESAYSVPIVPNPYAPKTLGQILSRTYRLIRGHFKLLVGIAAYPSCLLLLFIGLLEVAIWIPMIRQFPKQPNPEIMFRNFTPSLIIPVIVVFTLLTLAVLSIYLAAASYAATKADSGVKVTLRESYALAWQRCGRHVWLLVLCYVYAFLPLLIVELSAFLGASAFVRGSIKATPAMYLFIPLAILLYLAALVYGILMGLRLSLAYSACVEENLPALAAIKRSFQLARGAKGRIFLAILVIYAALYAAMLVIEIVAMLVVGVGIFFVAALHMHMPAPWNYIGLGLIGICVLIGIVLFISIIYAALLTALAVIYHDQRLRKDGPLPAPIQPGNLS